jgi:uncharacterized membrane protein
MAGSCRSRDALLSREIREIGVPGTDAFPERNETARVEAFSDGVLAIVITLLVLELQVPHDVPGDAALGAALAQKWPSYLAFVTSFATVGVMWVNHHRLFTLIGRIDHWLLMLNLLLLFFICIVPFPTAIVAEYLGRDGARTATLVLGGVFVCTAIVFNILWRYASASRRLIGHNVSQNVVDAQTRQYRFGPIFYLASFLLAFISPVASVAVNLAMAVFFALPLKLQR